MKNCSPNQTGFSLVEIAIVLLIVTLLTAGAITALRVQTSHARFTQTQDSLLEAKQALLAYAATQGFLPCPANPNTDINDASFGTCTNTNLRRGLIPWKTLGIQGSDAWGQYLSYEASPAFVIPSIYTTALGEMSVGESCGTATTDTSIAFAVWSQGANGNGAITIQGTKRNASTDADEQCNAPTKNPSPVILRAHSDSFDDQGLSVSRFVLFKQMLDAGVSIPRPSSSSSSSSSSGGSSTSSSGG